MGFYFYDNVTGMTLLWYPYCRRGNACTSQSYLHVSRIFSLDIRDIRYPSTSLFAWIVHSQSYLCISQVEVPTPLVHTQHLAEQMLHEQLLNKLPLKNEKLRRITHDRVCFLYFERYVFFKA